MGQSDRLTDRMIADYSYVTTGQPQLAGGVLFGTYNAPREWSAVLAAQL